MKKGSILIVEDESIVAYDLKRTIQILGYDVTGITSYGKDAIEAAKTNRPDLVLMDIVLKGKMNGIEASRVIQGDVGVPVIFLTAHADVNTLKQAAEINPYGYIVKPVEEKELKSSLDLAILRSRMERRIKDSEARFREIFQQNFDAIVLFKQSDHTVLDANPAAVTLFGYAKEDLVKSFHSVFKTRELYHVFVREVCNFHNHEGAVFLDRCQLIKRDGTEIMCSIRANIIRLQEDDTVYCTFRDDTESLRIEEESRKLQAKLIRTNRMTSLGTLASGVAHEINNPNNYIMSNTQIIQGIWSDAVRILEIHAAQHREFSLGGLPFEEVKELMPQLLKASLEGSQRIKNITDNLKSFSRNDEQETREMVEINQVLEFASAMLANEIKRYTDSFHFEPASSLPTFNGNPGQIEQVMVNLIQNALHALPDRSCAVFVSTRWDQSDDCIVVEVKDEGVGMNRSLIDRITDPFFTTKQEKGGTGLGLYVSYSIVKSHGASMEFDSFPGTGTTAWVRFPVSNHSGGGTK